MKTHKYHDPLQLPYGPVGPISVLVNARCFLKTSLRAYFYLKPSCISCHSDRWSCTLPQLLILLCWFCTDKHSFTYLFSLAVFMGITSRLSSEQTVLVLARKLTFKTGSLCFSLSVLVDFSFCCDKIFLIEQVRGKGLA